MTTMELFLLVTGPEIALIVFIENQMRIQGKFQIKGIRVEPYALQQGSNFISGEDDKMLWY